MLGLPEKTSHHHPLEPGLIAVLKELDRDQTAKLVNGVRETNQARVVWLEHALARWRQQSAETSSPGLSPAFTDQLVNQLQDVLTDAQRLVLVQHVWRQLLTPTRARLTIPHGWQDVDAVQDIVREHVLAILPVEVLAPEQLLERYPWLRDPGIEAQRYVLSSLLLTGREQLLRDVQRRLQILLKYEAGAQVKLELAFAGHRLLVETSAIRQHPHLTVSPLPRARRITNPDALFWSLGGAALGIGLGLCLWWLLG